MLIPLAQLFLHHPLHQVLEHIVIAELPRHLKTL